jgi:serine/threonine protein kinase
MSNSDAYRIVQQIGNGVIGPVFLADTPSGRVAIRQFRSGFDAESEEWLADLQHFLQGGRQAALLHHSGIVETLEVIDEGGDAYIATEFVAGQTCETLMARGTLLPAEATRVLRQVAVALDYAHQNGVTHGDLKPSNIFILPMGDTKISDFAISPRTRRHAGRMPSDLAHPYLSPEHLSDPETIGPRSDQYALAAIARRLYAGRSQFSGVQQDGVLLPAAVEAVLLKALSRSPDDRYFSCLQFVDAFEGSLAVPLPMASVDKKASKLLYMGIGAGALLLILAALLWPAARKSGPKTDPLVSASGPSGWAPARNLSAGTAVLAAEKAYQKPKPTEASVPGRPVNSKPSALNGVAASTGSVKQKSPLPGEVANLVHPGISLSSQTQIPSAEIALYSRERPIEQGKTFSSRDPEYGEMALGDLKAIVRSNVSLRKEKMTLQWLLDGQPTGPPQAVIPDQSMPYRNEPTPGTYKIILELNGNAWKTSSFTMTK